MASRPPPDLRRQKRRELDARRSRCRIRLGGHLERWCRLKDQLGFSLHSQLAQFLLDRYSSHGVRSSGDPDPTFLHADALQRLVVLSHGHGQECGFVPDVKAPPTGDASRLVWECVAGHTFSWGVPNPPGDCPLPSGHPRGEDQGRDPHRGSSPGAGRRRSLRRARPLGESGKGETEAEGGVSSPGGDGEQGEGGSCGGENTTPAVPEMGTAPKANGSARDPEEKREGGDEAQGEEEEEEEEEEDLAYSDDLRDENYHPSLDSDSEPQHRQTQPKAQKKPIKEEPPSHEPTLSSSSPPEEKLGGVSCRRRPPLPDEDVAQIGPKRIRKAAKRELLLCDFEGCGKIFSNRQYLNHHKKYQHVHQKTFTCSEPSCGKSFNFKKHLKEHQKLHTDTRDYICEFCARSFRTSSNLIIHRRIHTGEKPLQCEICGFTCRQKASLNWHMKKHSADTFYQFSCDICGKKFEKKDNVTAHKSKSHPQTPPGPPQLEGGQLEMVPSPNLGLGLDQPEVVEPLEVAGLGEEALGSEEEEEEKTPPALGTSREGPEGSQGDGGQGMDGVES